MCVLRMLWKQNYEFSSKEPLIIFCFKQHFVMQHYILQALFLCHFFEWVFRHFLPFKHSTFIDALTNTTGSHKYSPVSFTDFASSGVLVSFSAFIFSKKCPFLIVTRLFERLRTPSQSQKGHFPSKTKLRK